MSYLKWKPQHLYPHIIPKQTLLDVIVFVRKKEKKDHEIIVETIGKELYHKLHITTNTLSDKRFSFRRGNFFPCLLIT